MTIQTLESICFGNRSHHIRPVMGKYLERPTNVEIVYRRPDIQWTKPGWARLEPAYDITD
jgi:hypothetical protein